MLFLLQRWKLLALGAIALAAIAYHFAAVSSAYHRGHVAAQAECDAANLKAKIQTLEQLVAARDRVIASDKQEDARREQELAGLQEKTDAYIADIERLDAQGGSCRADAERAAKLRDIWRR
jgi:hypothetical protein